MTTRPKEYDPLAHVEDWEPVSTYYCVICGKCRIEEHEDGRIIIHADMPHPATLTFDEEERPQ